MNFHEFARMFRDGLGTPDALYLDGRSRGFTRPSLGRDDFGFSDGADRGLVARPTERPARALTAAGALDS